MKPLLLRILTFVGICLSSAIYLPAYEPIDAFNRWQVRDFYNLVFKHGTGVSMEWTGSYTTGDPGTVSSDWQEATRMRVNYFRAMAGIPSDVQFLEELNASCQEAALMMSANHQINHFPPTSWTWYTAAGADAAQHGNLALGFSGREAVAGYVADPGTFNSTVGHRRWVFYPQTETMGSGDAPGDGSQNNYQPTNTLWVIPQFQSARPQTRDLWVSWPPKGFVPATVVYARWSFSHPDADFTSATVSMESGGQPIPVFVEEVSTLNYGEPTIVWVPNGMDSSSLDTWPAPETDTPIQVTVDNVLISGTPQSFTYAVTIMDPDRPGEAEVATTLSPPAGAYPSVPVELPVSTRPWAEGVQGRRFIAEPYTLVHGAEGDDFPFIESISGEYTPVQNYRTASGNSAFYLPNPDQMPQALVLDRTFLVGEPSPAIEFDSSLAFATEAQYASLEVNLGDGDNWTSVWKRYGPVQSNSAFTHVRIDLSDWIGRTIRFRFTYYFDEIYGYWDTHPSTGWAIDNISFSGLQRIHQITTFSPISVGEPITTTFESLNPQYVQAREMTFAGMNLDWGPAILIQPSPYPGISAPVDQWLEDPVFGWVSGGNFGWNFSLVMGWVYTDYYPWIWTDKGWFYYVRGSASTTLWLYNPDYGYAYTSEFLGGWFNHQPYGSGDWKTFRN